MLVFYNGEWRSVVLPEHVDSSWSYFQRIQAAHLVLKGLQWTAIEKIIYSN